MVRPVDRPTTSRDYPHINHASPSRQGASQERRELSSPYGAPPSRQAMTGASNPNKDYKTIGMLKSGYNKDLNNAMQGVPVPYMNSNERRRHEVLVGKDDGHLYQRNSSNSPERPMDTRDGVNPKEQYLFAMDGRGNTYAAPSTTVQHHSSFYSGNPVAAAGSMGVQDGKLRSVSDSSGHYAPTREYSQQFVTEMRSRGVDTSETQTRYEGRSKAEMKKATSRTGTKFERMYPDGVKPKGY